MLFMAMHKVDDRMEAGAEMSHEFIQQMGAYVGRLIKEGVMKDGAGLHRSEKRARVLWSANGIATVERGPYQGSNELIASFALISTTDIDDAIARAIALGRAAEHSEVEVGPVVEAWDLTGKARPANAPHRFLLLVKASAAYEAGEPQPAAVRVLLDAWKRDGVLQSDASLRPSKYAARTKVTKGRAHWTDGPFTESKEMIAGYALLELASVEAARQLTEEYALILGDTEIDLREVAA